MNGNESCRLKKNIGDTERVGKVKKTKIMNFDISENSIKNFNKKSNQLIIKKKLKRKSWAMFKKPDCGCVIRIPLILSIEK